ANCLAEHNVVAGNPDTFNGVSSPLSAGNNRLVGNTVDAAYAPLAGAFRFGTPEKIFKNFGGKDYHLATGSPAINAGPRAEEIDFDLPSVDLDGKPRLLGGKLDHGCFEANPPGTLLIVR
ncbi:MAG: hypothetical protein FWF96_08350, partial [Kiritimatiellaeota bacterium]|nr:hypothetical protein [Kiritimatiellota bacterium]